MSISFLRKLNRWKKKLIKLFEEFFELLSPVDYAKMLINTKNTDENKKM